MKIWLYKKMESIRKKLDRVDRNSTTTLSEVQKMSAELDALQAEVAETRGVVDSAVILLNSLSQFIRDHATDPAALLQMAADLDASQADLAAAVAANQTP